MKIPVAAITDNKLAFALGTLFINLMETKNESTFYDLYAILSPDVTEENIAKIKLIEDKYKDKCSVNIIQMDSRFDNIKNKTGYIANACAYKMCLGELFPQYDKIVYLDTDIVVFDDLSELYNTELGNNYVAGVFGLDQYFMRYELPKKIGIPDMTEYINAGVLVLNLEQIREDKIEEKEQALIGTFDDSVDQHILNKVCYNRIIHVHPKWNAFQTGEVPYRSSVALCGMTKQEQEQIFLRPSIYHYTGTLKPWKYYNLKYSLIWQQYYKKSPFSSEVLRLKFTKSSPCIHNWINPYYKLDRKILIFIALLEFLYKLTKFSLINKFLINFENKIEASQEYFWRNVGGNK